MRDKTWLARLDFLASDDFRAIAHLAWLYRVRSLAATVVYESRLWAAGAGGSMSADFEETLTAATRIATFEEYLLGLVDSPWSMLRSVVRCGRKCSPRNCAPSCSVSSTSTGAPAPPTSSRTVGPGRRSSADDLLGFIGYGLSDPSILAAEFEAVLRPL